MAHMWRMGQGYVALPYMQKNAEIYDSVLFLVCLWP